MSISIKSGFGLTSKTITQYMVYDYVRYCVAHGMSGKQFFYCGISNNMDANYSRHKNDEFKGSDFEYVSIYKCCDSETAAEVELLLRKDGFDCGDTDTFGNGRAEDSVFIYMFKKP